MAESGAIRAHHTDTSNRNWDGNRNETNVKDARPVLRRAFAWADPGGDAGNKGTYKFIHHEVGANGEPGAANVRACISGIAVLNGGRGGAEIPASDRAGIYRHLAAHLRDAGHEPADLKK